MVSSDGDLICEERAEGIVAPDTKEGGAVHHGYTKNEAGGERRKRGERREAMSSAGIGTDGGENARTLGTLEM